MQIGPSHLGERIGFSVRAAKTTSPASGTGPALGAKPAVARWWEQLATRVVHSISLSPRGTAVLTHLLFALFVVYYAGAIIVLLQLIAYTGALLIGQSSLVWKILASLLALGCMLRLGMELLHGLVGLVTTKYDSTSPPVFGPLLDDSNAPGLQKLIGEIARETKCPRPHEVRITPHAECYVYEHREFGFVTNRRLVLVIGLPHLAVLTATELRIILGHELAHFAGGDTRLGVFLHRFLESLREPPQHPTLRRWRRFDPVYWVRTAYFYASQLLAAPIWRSQELRADAASAKAFGGRLSARTIVREWLLAQQFDEELFNRRLANRQGLERPTNVYDVFAARFRTFSSEAERYLRRRLADQEDTRLLAPHPSMRARLTAALSYPDQAPPDTSSARRLISDFDVVKEQMQAELLHQDAA